MKKILVFQNISSHPTDNAVTLYQTMQSVKKAHFYMIASFPLNKWKYSMFKNSEKTNAIPTMNNIIFVLNNGASSYVINVKKYL